jgi:hypothetical protein
MALVGPIAEPTTTRERSRSKIRFPYVDLGNAEDIARGVGAYGIEAQVADVASYTKASVGSGAFRSKIAAAAIFGLVESSRDGSISLTALGKALLDSTQEANARAEAFLNPELYRRVFSEYNGRQMPTDEGLERYMMQLGVTQKSAARARQAFQRSAEVAGFFAGGRDRLSRPTLGTVIPPAGASGGETDDGEEDVSKDPVLVALLGTLPSRRGKFSARDRRRFFTMLALGIDGAYDQPDDGEFDPAAMASLWKIAPIHTTRGELSPEVPHGGTDEPPF